MPAADNENGERRQESRSKPLLFLIGAVVKTWTRSVQLQHSRCPAYAVARSAPWTVVTVPVLGTLASTMRFPAQGLG